MWRPVTLLLWECSSLDLQNAALLLLRYACDTTQKKKQKCRNDGKINSKGRLNLRDNSSKAHCTPAKDTSPLVRRSDWGFTAWASRQPQCNQRLQRRQGGLSQFAVCQVSPETDMVSSNDYTDSITLKSASHLVHSGREVICYLCLITCTVVHCSPLLNWGCQLKFIKFNVSSKSNSFI